MNLNKIRIIAFIVIATSAIIFLVLERIKPYNQGLKVFRSGFFTDLILYNFAQTFLLGIIISYIIEAIDSYTTLSNYRLIWDWPIILQVLFFLVTHDLYIYLFHKWQHRNKFLWRMHEAHHSPKEVDWLSGVRSHALEILVNQFVEFLPIILLGARPEVAIYKGAISAIWGMFIHSNLDVKLGIFKYIINGPELHRWHHSTSKGRNRNFATKLSIWDYLFNTVYLPEKEKAETYGLKTFFPKNYFAQFLFLFRPFKKIKAREQ